MRSCSICLGEGSYHVRGCPGKLKEAMKPRKQGRRNRKAPGAFAVVMCDLAADVDRVVGRRSTREAAEGRAAELNRQAIAGNGGSLYRGNGFQVPLYYVVSKYEQDAFAESLQKSAIG